MIKIDWQSGIPAYDQIVQGMIKMRSLGAFNAGDNVPSVRNLAVKLGVNPNTVQKAYQILESKGVLYSVAGKGSFFSDNEKASAVIFDEAITLKRKEIFQNRDMSKIIDRLQSEIGLVEGKMNC